MSPTASAGQLKATQRGSHTSRTSTVTQVAQVLNIVTPSQKSHKSHKYCDTSTKYCHTVAKVTKVTQVANVLFCHCSNLLPGKYCNKVEADFLPQICYVVHWAFYYNCLIGILLTSNFCKNFWVWISTFGASCLHSVVSNLRRCFVSSPPLDNKSSLLAASNLILTPPTFCWLIVQPLVDVYQQLRDIERGWKS